MSDGIGLALIVVGCLIFGAIGVVGKQLTRIADFCERNERKASP